jgi:hypothetical protein
VAEHIGKIVEAGYKAKYKKEGQNFIFAVSNGAKPFNYYVNREQDQPIRDKALALNGKVVKVTYEQDGDYRNVVSLEEASAEVSARVEEKAQQDTTEAKGKNIMIAFESCLSSAVEFHKGKPASTDCDVSKTAEKWLCRGLVLAGLDLPAAEPTTAKAEAKPQPVTQNFEAEFRNACKEAGYDLTKQEGIDSVKAWVTRNFKTSLPFSQLAGAKQKELVTAMQKEKLPFS